MDKITSQTINFLRFPLIICVVSIHTVFIVPGNLRGYEVLNTFWDVLLDLQFLCFLLFRPFCSFMI